MDSLQEIIKCLTPAEKRYFKLFASAFKPTGGYLKLFDALDQAEEYDEAALKKKSGVRGLGEAKSYLRKLLFKAMRNYREEVTANQELRNALADIEFLMGKGLFEEARKEVHKAWKIAEETEIHNYSAEVLDNLGRIINRTLKADKMAADIETLQYLAEETLGKQREMQLAAFYHLRVVNLSRQLKFGVEDETRDKLRKIINDLRQQLLVVQTDYARMAQLAGLALAYMVMDELPRAREVYAEMHALYKKFPDYAHINPNSYCSFLHNYCIATSANIPFKEVSRELISEFEACFVKFDKFFKNLPDRRLYHFRRLNQDKISFAFTHSAWDMLDEVEKNQLADINETVTDEKDAHTLNSAMLVACFFKQKNYSKFFEWLNIYYALEKTKFQIILSNCIRIMEVLAYHELRDYDMSGTKANNLYKTMLEQKNPADCHQNLMVMLRKINAWQADNAADRKEIAKLLQTFRDLNDKNDTEYMVYKEYMDPMEFLEKMLTTKR